MPWSTSVESDKGPSNKSKIGLKPKFEKFLLFKLLFPTYL